MSIAYIVKQDNMK